MLLHIGGIFEKPDRSEHSRILKIMGVDHGIETRKIKPRTAYDLLGRPVIYRKNGNRQLVIEDQKKKMVR